MKKLAWAFIALVILIPLVAAAFFVGMRHAPLSPAQQRAMALLTASTPPVQGKDASDAIWLLAYDVPADRRADIARKLRDYRFALSEGQPLCCDANPVRDLPRFPEAPEPGEGHCAASKPEDCLAYVSEHRAQVAALLDDHRGGIENLRALAQYDGYRNGTPSTVQSPVPMVNTRRALLLSDFALRFAAGEQLTAIDQVCQDLGAWRRIGADADMIIVPMLGVEFVREDLVLLADMLRKLPRETELPGSCAISLQPSTAREFDLCPSVRSDFAMVLTLQPAAERDYAAHEEHAVGEPPPWTVDWRRLVARRAEAMAPYCDAPVQSRARADRPVQGSVRPAPGCDRWQKLADPYGCTLGQLAAGGSGFDRYYDRRADQAQMLALMRTVLWLRTEVDSKEGVEAALKRRPAELGLLREPAYDFENDRLSIPLHDARQRPAFTLAAGAEPRRASRPRRFCCSKPRASRNLAAD